MYQPEQQQRPPSRAARGAGFANGGSAAPHIDRNTGSNAPGRDHRRSLGRRGGAVGSDPEPAGDPATQNLPYSPTPTVTADGVDDRGDARPPENGPQGTSLHPDGSGPPSGGAPDGPARRPAWRRLGVPILAAAAALAVAIVLVLVVRASPGTKAGGASYTEPRQRAQPRPSHGGGDDTGRAGPQLRSGRAERQIRLHHRRRGEGDHGARHRHYKVSKTIPIPEGPPQFVSFSTDGKTAYVSVYNTNGSGQPLIAFINTATGQVTGQVPVTNHTPGPSQVSPNDRYLYVPNDNSMTMSGAMTAMSGPGQDDIDVMNTATEKLVDTITVRRIRTGSSRPGRAALCHEPHVRQDHDRQLEHEQGRESVPGGRDPARHIHLARRQPSGGHELRRRRGLHRQHRDRQGCRDHPGRPGTAGRRVHARRALHLHHEQRGQPGLGDRCHDEQGHRHDKTGKQPTSIDSCRTGARAT